MSLKIIHFLTVWELGYLIDYLGEAKCESLRTMGLVGISVWNFLYQKNKDKQIYFYQACHYIYNICIHTYIVAEIVCIGWDKANTFCKLFQSWSI